MANNSILARMAVLISANNAEFNKALADTNSKLNGFEQNFKRLGTTLLAGLGFASVAQGLATAVERMADFQHSMSTVKAITGATGEDFQKLRDNALNLGGAFKAIDISRMETDLGRLGFATKEILQSTKATVELATATGEDLAKSAMIAGSTLRSFNLDASQMQRVVDVMASSFNKSALGLDNFGEAIKYVAPVAQAAGISLEQTTAMLGVLADAGIKGSMAGTSLRKIISDLGQGAAPILTQKLKEMAGAGLTGAEAMDEVGRTAYASLLVLSNHTDQVEAATKAYQNANGEAAEMARIMQDDLIGDWNKFTAEIDKTIQRGSIFNEVGRSIVQTLTEILAALNYKTPDEDKLFYNKDGIEMGKILKSNRDILAGYDEILGRVGPKVKSFFEQLNPGKTGPEPLTPEQMRMMGMSQNKMPIPENIYKLMLGQTPKAGKAGSALTFDTEQIQKDLKGITSDLGYASQAYQDFFGAQDASDEEFKMFHEEVAPEVQAEIDGLINKHNALKNSQLNLALSARQMASIMRNELNSLAVSFGQLLGNLASGMNGQDLSKMLLGQLGSVLVELGRMLIAVGIGVEAFKESLKTLNGPVAIVAGIALVALGTAFANRANGAAGGSGNAGSGAARAADQLKVQPININVTGSLEMNGNGKLRAQIIRANYINGRTGG